MAAIEPNKIMLLSQLVTRLKESFEELEKSYRISDKENFDKHKKALLELQAKINYILK